MVNKEHTVRGFTSPKPLNRRGFLATSLALGLIGRQKLLKARSLAGLKLGVTDWNLRLAARTEAVELAARLGFQGVEVSLGRNAVDNKLPLDNVDLQAQYLAEFASRRIEPAGTCLDILHVNYLKNDPLGQKWVADGIRVTRNFKTPVMLLPFFGRGALETHAEMDYVADILKELGPEAEKAGVVLGIENTISAEDNARILERSASPAVRVYYDVGNSTNRGFDVVKEIRWLGTERICQFHLKDNPHYLGEGDIDFEGVVEAIADLRFQGFANLETTAPSGSIEDDMKRNLAFIRSLMEQVA